MKRIKESSLSAWVLYNLLGGCIGLVCGILLNLFITEPIKYLLRPHWLYDYHLEPLLSGVIFWLPVGFGIGTTQWIKLKHWRMQAKGWVLATLAGWCLLGVTYNYAIDYFPSGWQPFTFVLIGGMCVGWFQVITARKTLSRPVLWILINMLGIPALGIITAVLIAVPFALKSYILELFYALNLYVLVDARDLLLLVFLIISVAFAASLILFIPTGKILLKDGARFSEKENDGNSK